MCKIVNSVKITTALFKKIASKNVFKGFASNVLPAQKDILFINIRGRATDLEMGWSKFEKFWRNFT